MSRRLQIRVGRFPLGTGARQAVLSPATLQAIGSAQVQLQVGRIKQAFSAGGHHLRGGTRWAPLAPRTVRARKRRGRTRILVDTGRLRNTIFGRARVEPGAFAPLLRMLIVAPAPYAVHHQFGTRTMPARPPLEVTAEDRATIMRSIVRHVGRALNGGT